MELGNAFNFLVWGAILVVLFLQLLRSIRLVPQRTVMIVERLGRYHTTLDAGFHALIPFVDRVVTTFDLKEETIDVPPQQVFTKDEIKVTIDGVLYISVTDPGKACYGIMNYKLAAILLAQTTTRAVIGQIDLDRTFEERELISARVIEVLAQTGSAWGLQVHRYEIKNIQPPESVKNAMERQVTAERDRQAILAKTQGDKQAMINRSEGRKQELINRSEGEKQRLINLAEGQAAEIRALADAMALSIEKVAGAIAQPGGQQAVQLKMTETMFGKLGGIAQPKTEVILPFDLSQLDNMLAGLGLASAPEQNLS